MKNELFLSIVIPVRNLESFLPDCLQSIANQKKSFSYEILSVDSSSDRSPEIIRDWSKTLPITMLEGDKSDTAASARNLGLKQARGQYVWFVDGDDTVENGAFEILAEKLDGSDISVFGAKIKSYDARFLLDDISPENKRVEGDCMGAFLTERVCKPYIWNSVYKKDFLIDNKLFFDDECKTGEDVLLQFFCFEKAKDVSFFSDPIYTYHFLRNSQSLMCERLDREAQRIEESIKTLGIIVEKRQRDRHEKEFGAWVYSFLLIPILRLPDQKERERLILLCREVLLRGYRFDFSGLTKKEALKSKIIESRLLMKMHSIWKKLK